MNPISKVQPYAKTARSGESFQGARPRRHADQNKRAPEKHQHGERYGNSFGDPQAEGGPQPAQQPIEQHVVPLPRDPQSGRLPLPDQLRQPRIVEMAS